MFDTLSAEMKTLMRFARNRPLVALLLAHRAGDEAAFRHIDNLCRNRLIRWLEKQFRRSPLYAECLDAAQESLMRLALRTELFRSDRQILGWLRKTAMSRAINAQRKQRPTADSPTIERMLGGFHEH